MRILTVMVLLASTALAHAQPDEPEASGDARDAEAATAAGATPAKTRPPWVEGIPLEVRLEAHRMFLEGNAYMRDGLFVRAVERYQTALVLWEHPRFHYNLAIAQINLDQPIAAYESLQRALRYGAAPFDRGKMEQTQSFLTLLRNQLAQVEVVCDQPGAKVTLDGKPLFTGPGRYQGLVLPGGHQLLASAPGRIPATEQVVLAPGQHVKVALAPQLPDQLVTERRWPAWKPWAVAGAGAVVMAAGGYLDWRAEAGFDRFDAALAAGCTNTSGCEAGNVSASLFAQRDRAGALRWSARATYLVGGTTLAASAVLLYLNRELPVKRPGREAATDVSVVPVLTPQTAGVSARWQF